MSNTSSVHNVTRLVVLDVHARPDDGGWITFRVESEFGGSGKHDTDFTFFSDNVPQLAREMLIGLEQQLSQL